MKKKKIAWITDSVSCISPELAEKHNIHVIPLSLIFSADEIYNDGVDLTYNEFYQKLSESDKSPTTSQPAIGEFVALFEKLKEEYEMGFAIHVTSKVSGTYNASVMAAEMAGFPMIHIDSKVGAKPLEYMVLEGIRLEKEGLEPKEIEQRILELTQQVQGFALIGNLQQLHKSGRVSGLGLLLGNILQIKPILYFNEGSLIPFEKVRTTKKAEQRIFEIFENACNTKHVYGVSVVHGNNIEKTQEYIKKIKTINPDFHVEIGDLSPTVAAHVGEGTITLFWFEKEL